MAGLGAVLARRTLAVALAAMPVALAVIATLAAVRALFVSARRRGGLSAQAMLWPISFSISATALPSPGPTMVMAVPLLPARPVRPMRWT